MGALSLEAPASRTAEARENVELADAGSAHEPGHATASRIWLRPSIAVGGWFALVLATNVWGQVLLGQGRHLFLGTPPLYGWLRSVQPGRIALPLLGAIAVAACAARWGVALSARLGWRALLCWTAVAAAVWAVALALVDPLGPAALVRPLRLPTESYQLPLPPSVLDFLRHYVARLPRYPVQLRGHPPGMVLVLWALRWLGLGEARWAAGLMIGAWAAAVPAALAAYAALGGKAAARRAAPFLVVGPAAIWVATSADALFAAVATAAIALFVAALHVGARQGARHAHIHALGSGLLFGCALFLTYGVAPLALVFVVVAAARHRWRELAAAALGAGAVAVAFGAAGFWWFEGLLATRVEVHRDVAHSRPYSYFVVANLAALAIALGPAVVAGLTGMARSLPWLLTAAAVAALAATDASGLVRGEVERIWLPFVPWLLIATGGLRGGERSARRWLLGQGALAIGLQTGFHFPW